MRCQPGQRAQCDLTNRAIQSRLVWGKNDNDEHDAALFEKTIQTHLRGHGAEAFLNAPQATAEASGGSSEVAAQQEEDPSTGYTAVPTIAGDIVLLRGATATEGCVSLIVEEEPPRPDPVAADEEQLRQRQWRKERK